MKDLTALETVCISPCPAHSGIRIFWGRTVYVVNDKTDFIYYMKISANSSTTNTEYIKYLNASRAMEGIL